MGTTKLNVRKKIGNLFCKLKSLFKHKKACINNNINDSPVQKNNINDFPDEILINILCFVPIKDAFRTRVLSKRWLTLCYLLPTLHFSTLVRSSRNLAREQNLFHQMLEDVMFSPHSHHRLPLESFRLEYFFNIWGEEVEDWSDITRKCIEAAKQRGVQCIYLSFLPVHLLPTTIFCCKTVVVMTLKSIHVANMLNCVVDLTLLKTLTLDNVGFQTSEDFMKLLSGCPKLEELNTNSIRVNGGFPVGDYLKPLSTLIKADITLFEIPYRAVYNVKSLTVSGFGLSLLDEERNSFYKGFPVFQNLAKLKLHWRPYLLHDWNEVLKVLPNCPNLQTLQIKKTVLPPSPKDCKYPRRVPDCISSNLKMCEIIGYKDYKEDFQFTTYILQNARVLQVMNICYTVLQNPQFLEDFFSHTMISPICKLSVSKS